MQELHISLHRKKYIVDLLSFHINYNSSSFYPHIFFLVFRNKLLIFWVYLNTIPSKSNGYSKIPVVGTRARRISCSVGKKSGCSIRGKSLK